MASLDAESLFANVSCNKTINNCVEDLCDSNTYHGKLSQDDLYRIIKLITSEATLFLTTNSTNKLAVLQWNLH